MLCYIEGGAKSELVKRESRSHVPGCFFFCLLVLLALNVVGSFA